MGGVSQHFKNASTLRQLTDDGVNLKWKGQNLPISAAAIVQALYAANAGHTFEVTGPKVTGSDPPLKSSTTIALVAWYTNLGIPESNILWNVVGEEGGAPGGTFTVPDGNIALTNDSIALIFNGGTFTVPDSTIALTNDNIVLVNPNIKIFDVPDGTIALTNDTITLVRRSGTFIVPDGNIALTNDGVTLVRRSGTFIVPDGNIALTNDSITLTKQVTGSQITYNSVGPKYSGTAMGTVTLPTHNAGDLLLMAVNSNSNLPSGWSNLVQNTTAINVYGKIATGSGTEDAPSLEGIYNSTYDTWDPVTAKVWCFSGVHSSIVDVKESSGTSSVATVVSGSSLTVQHTDAVIVFLLIAQNDATACGGSVSTLVSGNTETGFKFHMAYSTPQPIGSRPVPTITKNGIQDSYKFELALRKA